MNAFEHAQIHCFHDTVALHVRGEENKAGEIYTVYLDPDSAWRLGLALCRFSTDCQTVRFTVSTIGTVELPAPTEAADPDLVITCHSCGAEIAGPDRGEETVCTICGSYDVTVDGDAQPDKETPTEDSELIMFGCYGCGFDCSPFALVEEGYAADIGDCPSCGCPLPELPEETPTVDPPGHAERKAAAVVALVKAARGMLDTLAGLHIGYPDLGPLGESSAYTSMDEAYQEAVLLFGDGGN